MQGESGPRVTFVDSDRISGTSDWTRISAFVFVPQGVRRLKVALLLNGHGRAYFDNITLKLSRTAGPLPNQKVSIHYTDRPVQNQFLGFGFEDDPFFFTENNRRQGVTEEDAKLRQRRIEELSPSLVRMFLFWDAFNPSHDMKTFTDDTDFMRSLFRHLDLYQALKVPVLICDIQWGWEGENFPYTEKNVERGVDCYLRILKHLIEDRGYTCIQYLSITVEPDVFHIGRGGTYNSYIRANKLFAERLKQSSLKDQITLVGCDMGLNKKLVCRHRPRCRRLLLA